MLTCETRESALARIGRALADPTRCRILVALLDGVAYPAQLAERLGLTRSNVSNHLSCLRGCGLVLATYEGRQVRYTLADPHLAHALSELTEVVLAVAPTTDCSPADRPPTEAGPATGTAPTRLAESGLGPVGPTVVPGPARSAAAEPSAPDSPGGSARAGAAVEVPR